MEKVYWYCSGESPDSDFFKYGKRKPSDSWCMFKSLLECHKHAFNEFVKYDWEDEDIKASRPKNLKQYIKFAEENEYIENIIEIPLHDAK